MDDLVRYAPLLGQGFLMTVGLSLTVMVSAFVLGLGLAVLRFYRVPVLAWAGDVFVTLVRSIPALMLLVLIHFGLLPALGLQNSFLVSAYVGLTLYTTAYLAEILRGGFQAIHPEEFESAISLGLQFYQRLYWVILPLVLYRIRPALINQMITLIKDTSLASVLGVIELTRAAEIINESTLHEVVLLGFVAMVYFGLCYGLSCWARQFKTDTALWFTEMA